MSSNFTLDSLSPTISYSSVDDWSQFSSETSTKTNGASLSFPFVGSNLWLIGDPNNYDYTVSIDGTHQDLGDHQPGVVYSNLQLSDQDALHQLVLSSTSGSYLAFDSATWQIPSDYVGRDSYNSSYEDFAYRGGWDLRTKNGSGFDGHTTSTPSSSAKFSFSVSSMAVIYGLVCSECGQYSVILDGDYKHKRIYNASKPVSPHETVLYYGAFPDGDHSLVISYLGGSSLSISRAEVMQNTTDITLRRTANKHSSRKLNVEDTIAIIVASVVFFLILCGTYIYHWIRRRKLAKTPPTNEKTDSANPFSDHSVVPVTTA